MGERLGSSLTGTEESTSIYQFQSTCNYRRDILSSAIFCNQQRHPVKHEKSCITARYQDIVHSEGIGKIRPRPVVWVLEVPL